LSLNPLTSVPLVLGGNLFSAAIGLIVGLFAARTLGAELFGAIGIVLALCSVVANLVDVRLTDIASRLVYSPERTDERPFIKHDILAVALGISGVAGVLITLLGALLATLTLRSFSAVHLHWNLLLLFAVVEAANAPLGVLMLVHRLSDRVSLMVAFQVLNALLRGALVVAALLLAPGADSYAVALAAAACVGLVFGWFVAAVAWPGGFTLWIRRERFAAAMDRYKSEVRLAVSANLMGYAKMLHRGGDLLLVGWFCSDAQTGVYRLARSLADALLLLYDAMNRIYQPVLLSWIQLGKSESYRSSARALLLFGAAVAGLVASGAFLAGDRMLATVVGSSYAGLALVLGTHLGTLFFTIGLQLWLWPLILARDDARSFAFAQLGAVLVSQYLAGVAMWWLSEDRGAFWFALGHVSAYVLMFGFVWHRARNDSLTAAYLPRLIQP
jgi:O-antigen/teichoic acid export membrane protein